MASSSKAASGPMMRSTWSRSTSSWVFVLVPAGLPPVSATTSSALRPARVLFRSLKNRIIPCSIWIPPWARGPVFTVSRPTRTGLFWATAGMGSVAATTAPVLTRNLRRVSPSAIASSFANVEGPAADPYPKTGEPLRPVQTTALARRIPALGKGSRAVQRIDLVGGDPLDAGPRALERRHLDLDQELRARETRDPAAQGCGAAPGKPRWPLAMRAIHVGTLHGEDAPPDDVLERGAGLAERPLDRAVGHVGLARPVPLRLDLAGRVHRRAAAHVDPVADLDGARVAARLLALALRVDIPPRAGRADDGLGLDLDEHLRADQRRDAEQRRDGSDVAQRLQPGPGIVVRPAQIGQERLGVDEVLARPARLGQGAEDGLHGGARLPVHVAHALDHAPRSQRRGAGDEHAIAHPHGPRVRVLLLDGPPGRDPPRRLSRAVHGVELDLDQLLRSGQPADLHQRGDRSRLSEVLRVRPGRLVGDGDVGDVDAAPHHVGEPSPGLAHAPLCDAHDRVDLP